MIPNKERRKRNNLNTWLLALGMLLIVIDGLVMTLPGLGTTAVKALLVGSIVVCALLIAVMVWNIIREGRRIKNGEEQE